MFNAASYLHFDFHFSLHLCVYLCVFLCSCLSMFGFISFCEVALWLPAMWHHLFVCVFLCCVSLFNILRCRHGCQLWQLHYTSTLLFIQVCNFSCRNINQITPTCIQTSSNKPLRKTIFGRQWQRTMITTATKFSQKTCTHMHSNDLEDNDKE